MENGKIKVLHYGLSDNNGGVEIDVLSWFRNKPNDFQFDFINDSKNPIAFQDEYLSNGCKVYNIPFRYDNPIKRIRELNKIIKNGNYDFIHINVQELDEGSPIVIANKTKGCRPIVHCHSTNDREYPFKERLLLLETKLMLIGQDYLKLSCGKVAGEAMFGEDKFEIIENGINTNKFKFNNASRNEIRSKYGIKENDIVIGHIGHACADKNYPFIFETFKNIKKQNDCYKLMLVGNVCDDDSIMQVAKDLDIMQDTICTGMVEDASQYYSAMDVFFFPSLNEGMPLATIEAQVSGLPCVIGDAITYESKISDIAVFTSMNVDEATNKIITMSNLKIDRDKIQIDNRYDIKNSSKKLFDYYRNNLKDTYGK